MEIKMMHNDLKYLMIYGFSAYENPYIYGYTEESERDKAFHGYLDTGEINIKDENLGIEDTFKPTYLIRADVSDGAIIIDKGDEENE